MEHYYIIVSLTSLAHTTPRHNSYGKSEQKVYTRLVEDRAVRVPRWPHWALPWSPVSLAPQLGPPAADAAKCADKVGHYSMVPALTACVNGVNGNSRTCLPLARGREWLVHRWCLVSWQFRSEREGRWRDRDIILNSIITFIYKRQLFRKIN